MMMTMMIKRRLIVLVLVLVFASLNLFSQKKDFGIWYNVKINHDITKKLELELSPTLRTFKNASEIEEVFFEGELSYKLTKYLSFAGSYRFTKNIEDDDKYHTRHKWYAGVKGSFEYWRLDFTGRARFERRYKTYFEDEEDKIPDSYFRLRLKSVLKTPSFPINPYVSGEIFFPLNKEPERTIDKYRYVFGAEYKISKNHAVEIEYLYQQDYFPKRRNDHIISLGYNLKF